MKPAKRVLIVGGGLAGLACAVHLQESGAEPVVLEAGNDVGGRVRTDEAGGFLLDRGFQVFLDAYPNAGKLLDLPGLDLHAFEPGALVYRNGKLRRVMDVFRTPRHLVSSALAPVGSWGDKLRVAALKWRLGRSTIDEIASREDLTTELYLQRAGFSSRMIDGFFRSFYGGIFLERDLRTSSRMFEFTFKMFSEGKATLPVRGMQEIPRQLGRRLPPGTVRTQVRAILVQPGKVMLDTGEWLEGDEVVVATDLTSAGRLLPGLKDKEPPAWRAVTGLYFASDVSPLQEGIIALNGSGHGLVNHVCVLSDVAPGYAPPGQSLISVSVLGLAPDADLESQVLKELESWFGPSAKSWRHLRTDRIPRALPEQPPEAGTGAKGFREIEGVFVCGDHTSSASIEGAVTSGLRAAEAVLTKHGRMVEGG
jgi:phytoene dehydrogenase-like protein